MKVNKKLVVAILSVITVFAIISSTLIFQAMIIDDDGDDDDGDDESTLLFTPQQPTPEPETSNLSYSYITSITENKGYNTTKGIYYDGSPNNFNDEDVGTSGTDNDFVDVATLPNDCSVTIINEIDDHKNVLGMLNDGGGSAPTMIHNFPNGNEIEGIREFYIGSSDVAKLQTYELWYGGSTKITINIFQNKIYHYPNGVGVDTNIVPINNVLYHIKITFDCSAGTNGQYQLYINEAQIGGDHEMKSPTSYLNGIYMRAVGIAVYTQYIDSWGDPNDPNYNEGDNLIPNVYRENIESLKYDDGLEYVIEGHHTNPYEFDIVFEYDLNYEHDILNPLLLKNYDLFLALELTSNTSEIINFQGFSNDWYNITSIANDSIEYDRLLVNETLKFRIFGNTTNPKNISIDKLSLIFQNNKELGLEQIDTATMQHGKDNSHGFYKTYGSWNTDDLQQYRWSWRYSGWHGSWITVKANLSTYSTYFSTELYIYSVKSTDYHTPLTRSFYIYNYTSSEWQNLTATILYEYPYFILPIEEDYLNGDLTIQYKITLDQWHGTGDFTKRNRHYSKKPYVVYDYPAIEDAYACNNYHPYHRILNNTITSTNQYFQIKANTIQFKGDITSCKYLIEGWETWNDMYQDGHTWRSYNLISHWFEANGIYRIWANITDSEGLSTVGYFDLISEMPPKDFILESDAEEPTDNDASFTLSWTESKYQDNYLIYEFDKFITEFNNSLTFVKDNGQSREASLTDVANGTHYYIIVAQNEFGNTTSNCIKVIIDKYPHDFELSTDAGDPIEYDGFFNLTWTESLLAKNYSLYQSNDYFFDPLDATLLADGITILNHTIDGLFLSYTDDIYYYRILAFNDFGNSTSNCIEVDVQVLPKPFEIDTSTTTYLKSQSFTLSWNSINAVNYSLYFYTNNMSESVLLIENTTELSYIFSLSLKGTYHFYVIAENDYGFEFSEILEITIIDSPIIDDDDDDDDKDDEEPANLTWLWITIGCVGGGVGVGIVLYYINKKKSLFKFR